MVAGVFAHPHLAKDDLTEFLPTRRPDLLKWWTQAGLNRRPCRCERHALPSELWALGADDGDRTRENLIHRQAWDASTQNIRHGSDPSVWAIAPCCRSQGPDRQALAVACTAPATTWRIGRPGGGLEGGAPDGIRTRGFFRDREASWATGLQAHGAVPGNRTPISRSSGGRLDLIGLDGMVEAEGVEPTA